MKTRKGFTFIEVLTTITIISVLAAVLIPVVGGKIAKGDVSAVTQDAIGLRSAVETFYTEVQAVPRKPRQLINPIAVADSDLRGVTFLTSNVTRWQGPYLQKDSLTFFAPGAFVGGTVVDSFFVSTGTNKYVGVMVTGMTHDLLTNFDKSADNADSTTGMVTFKKDTLWMLIYPMPQ